MEPVSTRPSFVEMEKRILQWWTDEGIIEKYLHRNDASERRWSFIDGPITANNPMGVHHAWGRSYKDAYQRFHTMLGEKQRYQNGFDCQGLWIEVEVEKEHGFTSKKDIVEYGVDKFVDECKARVQRFADRITEQSLRLGQWMDWDNSYYTNSDENNYTIWGFLKTCYDKGFVYKGHDVMPWCPRCGTGISEHEIVTDGYREVTHQSVYVKFPLLERPGEYLLVWTTTPWTLPGNIAAAVHPDLTYLKVLQDNNGVAETVYVSKGAAKVALKPGYEELGEVKGSELVGLMYRGPFDELPVAQNIQHRVIEWKDVSDEEGTGIVHIAPGCGKEDFGLSKQFGLLVIAPVNDEGVYLDGFGALSGTNVGETSTRDAIFEQLREKRFMYRTQQYPHRYPHCWRCGTELIFRLVDEWFISMDELRDQISDVTRQIRWIPDFGLARELDWLKNMDDWMISKKRYYGLALPIYNCECGHFEVIGSETQLKERAVEGWEVFEGHSPHKPFIDAVKIACAKCGAVVSRIPDVGNPWLDAGIVPYATLHYRDDKSYWEEWFPAAFITEAFPGQFRNWFYSLLTMSTALENRPPFETVLGHAMVRDEHGAEMHKSAGNAIWFEDAADNMGVDVMRWLFMRHNPANNINFGYGPADEVRRSFFLTLWNTYAFFVTYALLDGWSPSATANSKQRTAESELDRWVLSELHQLVETVTERLADFDIAAATKAIEAFVDDLSNWYVRRSRRRFWKSESDADKGAAYATLYECLVTLTRLLAPITPFLAEEMYQNLVVGRRSSVVGEDAELRESVHLTDWPVADSARIDRTLSDETRLVMRVASLGRAARSKAAIKVRQPIQSFLPIAALVSDERLMKKLAEQAPTVRERAFALGVAMSGIAENYQFYFARSIGHFDSQTTIQEEARRSLATIARSIESLDKAKDWINDETIALAHWLEDLPDAWPSADRTFIECRVFRERMGREVSSASRALDEGLRELSAVVRTFNPRSLTPFELEFRRELQKVIKLRNKQRTLHKRANELQLAVEQTEILIGMRRFHKLALRNQRELSEELNVRFQPAGMDLNSVLEVQLKPNFKQLAGRLGQSVQGLNDALRNLSFRQKCNIVQSMSEKRSARIANRRINPGELVIEFVARPGYVVAADESLVWVSSTKLTPELVKEGLAREIVHRIQNLRKDAGFEIADRIRVYFSGDEEVRAVMSEFGEYVRQETLAVDVTGGDAPTDAQVESADVDGHAVTLGVVRV